MKRIGILGGTFNPVHIGHIRPAVEVYEAFTPDYIDIVPCASPPHKSTQGLLPFSIRVAMLRAACAPFPYLRINTLEAEREGPSYTYDSLVQYNALGVRPFFILGAGDFAMLPQWYKGLEIIELADIVVLPRSGDDITLFHNVIRQQWPDSAPTADHPPNSTCSYAHTSGHHFYYLPQPRLDISATLVRERWLSGRNISYLVPEPVAAVMAKNKEEITSCWTS